MCQDVTVVEEPVQLAIESTEITEIVEEPTQQVKRGRGRPRKTHSTQQPKTKDSQNKSKQEDKNPSNT